MRTAGILMHISSLPSPHGIGTFGKAAYAFADFLEKAGVGLWQILPLGPTGFGDSPYQSFSTFAGNPYFIDLDLLCAQGYLSPRDLEPLDGADPARVDYARVYNTRFGVLRTAYRNAKNDLRGAMDAFYAENKAWLEDYALFMALKGHFKNAPFTEWNDNIKLRTSFSRMIYKELLREEIDFQIFLQYLFFTQYRALKAYVSGKGIRIVGDLPIYVAPDSADAWAHSEVFQLDAGKRPVRCAGVPPDAFSETGQLWGNPLYDWAYLKSTGYAWWMERLRQTAKLFDVVRIDHFRGFDEYWSIPAGETTAVNGRWEKGPALDFFTTLKAELPDLKIIAEDLGLLTDSVHELLRSTGYPGMKVLEFAFDESERSRYLPQYYDKNCVVYTGTHDNDTLRGWLESLPSGQRAFAARYLAAHTPQELETALLRAAWSSVADTAVAQMQDFLSLSGAARMNTPSTLGGNWAWRALPSDFSDALAEDIRRLNQTYGRI